MSIEVDRKSMGRRHRRARLGHDDVGVRKNIIGLHWLHDVTPDCTHVTRRKYHINAGTAPFIRATSSPSIAYRFILTQVDRLRPGTQFSLPPLDVSTRPTRKPRPAPSR